MAKVARIFMVRKRNTTISPSESFMSEGGTMRQRTVKIEDA
jgi:hypothetical protein